MDVIGIIFFIVNSTPLPSIPFPSFPFPPSSPPPPAPPQLPNISLNIILITSDKDFQILSLMTMT